jgi:hypothetical protein
VLLARKSAISQTNNGYFMVVFCRLVTFVTVVDHVKLAPSVLPIFVDPSYYKSQFVIPVLEAAGLEGRKFKDISKLAHYLSLHYLLWFH